MNRLLTGKGWARTWEVLGWMLFYLTVHFNANDTQLPLWVPMKFIVAVPQVIFCIGAVHAFNWLFAQPLNVSIGRILGFGVGSFVLLHVVYYYSMAAAQPFTPLESVTHRRWIDFMASRGPFYFLHSPRYLLTVSSFLYFSMICLPLGVKLLRKSFLENQLLAAAHQQQLAWELAAIRIRLNPIFFQQTLRHIAHLLDQQQVPVAAEATLKLAQVLRHTLYENREIYIPIQREIDTYLDYVQLQELRLQDQVDFTLRLTIECAEHQTVLSGILLPLTDQWLTLGATTNEIELRVVDALLTLHLRAQIVLDQDFIPLPAIIARLAHLAGNTHRLIYQRRGAHACITLELPLRKQLDPFASETRNLS